MLGSVELVVYSYARFRTHQRGSSNSTLCQSWDCPALHGVFGDVPTGSHQDAVTSFSRCCVWDLFIQQLGLCRLSPISWFRFYRSIDLHSAGYCPQCQLLLLLGRLHRAVDGRVLLLVQSLLPLSLDQDHVLCVVAGLAPLSNTLIVPICLRFTVHFPGSLASYLNWYIGAGAGSSECHRSVWLCIIGVLLGSRLQRQTAPLLPAS